jgi:Type I phosphodiesterase / nucleotide pyrophosphatase
MATNRNVIIFVADGLRPGSINATDTPTLYSIKQSGVNFANSHSLFPTFTTPNASAIATGHYLGDTGDFSNTVYTGYPVLNSNGTVTPFIENDPILADINANSNLADPDTSFSKNNFLTEESLLAYARLNGYSTAAIGKLGPVAIFDPTQDVRTGGAATANITPKTVILDDSTYINSIANATSPPTSTTTGSQLAIPLSTTIANDLNAAGLIGTVIPGTTTVAATIGSIRSNQSSGNLTTAGTLNANTQQQQFFADATTKAVLPQFVADIAAKTSNGFAAVYWSRDPDGTQHNNGDAFNAADPGNNSLTIGINGPTVKKGVADADANLAQIIAYLKATDDPANPGKKLYDNTDIFVTADHGFSTISKQAVGVTFDAAGTPTFIPTKSYAATLDYYTTDAAGVKTPTVHKGFLPPGFVAIDLAKDLGAILYDPGKPTAPVTAANINNIQYTAIDPTAGLFTTQGNAVIGGTGKVTNGAIDAGTKVVVAANGGSDLLYVPSNDPALVKQIVAFLAAKDYISGIFTDDKFGDVPGALKMSTIGLIGTAELPTPSIAINFKTFSTNPKDPNDPYSQVEVADTSLQQGQGMHGSFGRGDTFNNMAAIGPDFKTGYVDTAPVSNADVVPTLAKILGWTLPAGV